ISPACFRWVNSGLPLPARASASPRPYAAGALGGSVPSGLQNGTSDRRGLWRSNQVSNLYRRPSRSGVGALAPLRELEAERGAAAGPTHDSDRPAVELDDVLDDREAETGAGALARARRVHAIEALEHPVLVLGRDPGAGVAHLAPDVPGAASERHRDAAALGVLEGVVQQ